MFGLSDNDLRLIRDTLRTFDSIFDVKIFGSRVLGSFKPGSDIDLAIFSSTSDFLLLCRIAASLDALDLPLSFDLIFYQLIENAELKAHIDSVGVSIWN